MENEKDIEDLIKQLDFIDWYSHGGLVRIELWDTLQRKTVNELSTVILWYLKNKSVEPQSIRFSGQWSRDAHYNSSFSSDRSVSHFFLQDQDIGAKVCVLRFRKD